MWVLTERRKKGLLTFNSNGFKQRRARRTVPRQEVCQRLLGFANRVARQVSDTRRQQFLRKMIVGLVVGGHVHLSKIARAAGCGLTNVHAAEKRLSRHLKSEGCDTVALSESADCRFYFVTTAFFPSSLRVEDDCMETCLHHPWQLRKPVTSLFDWLATQIALFLHPKPKILPNGSFDTG